MPLPRNRAGSNNDCSKAGSLQSHDYIKLFCRFDHDIKGQGIYAYVTLHEGNDYSDEIRKDLVKTVREQIGAFAAPDVIHWAPGQLELQPKASQQIPNASRKDCLLCFSFMKL